MSGCCLREVSLKPSLKMILQFRDGIMYKPGASFYDAETDKTLVCCSGTVYASLDPPAPPPVEEKTVLACPTYSCGDLR